MERIQALIDKLYQQKQLNSNPAQLLLTVQMLQTELLKLQHKNGSIATGKVAVTLPVNMSYNKETVNIPQAEVKVEEPVVIPPIAPVQETKQPVIPQQEVPSFEQYELKRPSVVEETRKIEEPKKEEVLETVRDDAHFAYMPRPVNPAFDTAVESPTLTQHQVKKEVHELIAEQKESLNDRLKQEKTELAQVLKDTPIKDLRKGIGINDRFTFVNELFRGDTAMYERSIKTINNFHIFSEAEYWISRELKYKLGWDETKDVVQQFYYLVRRRFA